MPKGNRRKTGKTADILQKPWKDDQIILDRIHAGITPFLRRRSPAECLALVNDYIKAKYPDEPPIGIDTLYLDRKRGMQLYTEATPAKVDEHLAEYDEALSVAWQDVSNLKPGHVRAELVGQIRQLITEKAKLDQSLRPETQVNVVINQQIDKLVLVFETALMNPEWKLDASQRAAGKQMIAQAIKKIEGI